MPRAIPVPERELIVARHQAGEALAVIAADLGRSPWTVRGIWRRYREQGAAGLRPAYGRCGRSGPRGSRFVDRAACWLRRRRPRWGAALIRAILAQRYPAQPLPHPRTMERWFAARGLVRPPRPPREPPLPRATQPHQVWQLEATEQIRLADGRRVSWLSVVDEASGAILRSVVFFPRVLVPGRAAGGASRPAGHLRPVGLARPVARRQRRAVGLVERLAA